MTDQNQISGKAPLLHSLGSANADFQVRTDRRPEPGETLLGRDFVRLAGGKAANVAFLARKLGAPSRLFARLGDDDLAEQVLAPLREVGVDLSGTRRVPGKGTGVAMICVPPDGNKGIVLAPNANGNWNPEDAEEVARAISEAPGGSVLVADCEVPVPVLEKAAIAARGRGFVVILDPSPADRVTDKLLGAIDILVPNSSEASQLTGIEVKDKESAVRAADILIRKGSSTACMKLPDGGCVVVSEKEIIHISSPPVRVEDTTGAGDAFAGALGVALLERQACGEATRFAVAASHLAVTRYGSQPSYPYREQIERMQQRLEVIITGRS